MHPEFQKIHVINVDSWRQHPPELCLEFSPYPHIDQPIQLDSSSKPNASHKHSLYIQESLFAHTKPWSQPVDPCLGGKETQIHILRVCQGRTVLEWLWWWSLQFVYNDQKSQPMIRRQAVKFKKQVSGWWIGPLNRKHPLKKQWVCGRFGLA